MIDPQNTYEDLSPAEPTDEEIMSSINACAGLTTEQVAAIPRLVAWFRSPVKNLAKLDELEQIFVEAAPCGSSSSNL